MKIGMPSLPISIKHNQITYLAAKALDCEFSEDSLYILPGKRRVAVEERAGGGAEDYWVDEDALFEMMLDIFYMPEEP